MEIKQNVNILSGNVLTAPTVMKLDSQVRLVRILGST